jgi:hypothetical protein
MTRVLLLSALIAVLPFTPGIASNASLPSGDDKPQIISDAKTKTVRILVDGKEIVRIDSRGLHVTGDLTYTGTEADTDANANEPRK